MLSDNDMLNDRIDAGIRLADKLKKYEGKNCLILAIPRGGVPVAYEIFKKIHGKLDLIVVRKLGLPLHPEMAMGAVAPDGSRILDESTIADNRVTKEEVDRTTRKELNEIKRRLRAYRGSRHYPELKDRTVIVVDDGAATGMTVAVAADYLKNRGAKKIIIAVPAVSAYSAIKLKLHADELITVMEKEPFFAVGQFYKDFPQVSDDEVEKILESVWSR